MNRRAEQHDKGGPIVLHGCESRIKQRNGFHWGKACWHDLDDAEAKRVTAMRVENVKISVSLDTPMRCKH